MIRNKFLVNKLSASALSLLAVGLFVTNIALQPVCAMDKELGDKMGKLSIAPKTEIPQTFEEWKEQMQQEQLKEKYCYYFNCYCSYR